MTQNMRLKVVIIYISKSSTYPDSSHHLLSTHLHKCSYMSQKCCYTEHSRHSCVSDPDIHLHLRINRNGTMNIHFLSIINVVIIIIIIIIIVTTYACTYGLK